MNGLQALYPFSKMFRFDKVVMPSQSEMKIRGAVDDSANKLTYETDMLVEANETFLKKDKALEGRSLVF
jgi:hypothetical protein